MREDPAWDERYRFLKENPGASRTRLSKDLRPEILKRLDPLLRADGEAKVRVLETGCGTGRLIGDVAQGGNRFCCGLDASQESLLFSKRNARELGCRVELIRGDMCQLPIRGETFDIIFSDSVLEHIPDTEKAVCEMAAILRPGGYLFVTVPNRWRPDGWDLYKRLKPPSYLQKSFSPPEMLRMFRRAGLVRPRLFGAGVILGRNWEMLWKSVLGARPETDRKEAKWIRGAGPGGSGGYGPPAWKKALKRLAWLSLPRWMHVDIGVVGQKPPAGERREA